MLWFRLQCKVKLHVAVVFVRSTEVFVSYLCGCTINLLIDVFVYQTQKQGRRVKQESDEKTSHLFLYLSYGKLKHLITLYDGQIESPLFEMSYPGMQWGYLSTRWRQRAVSLIIDINIVCHNFLIINSADELFKAVNIYIINNINNNDSN